MTPASPGGDTLVGAGTGLRGVAEYHHGVPELRFVADTHPELVRQVKAWLASTEAERDLTDLVDATAELTKDALRIVASAAPAPVAESEVVKGLTDMGYRLTDSTRDAVKSGLDGLAAVTDGRLVRQVSGAGARAAYEMNANVARQLLRSILRR
ncbi:MAG: hypothetical protein D6683_01760 [Actinomyces sp.]|nr:MAG: hypothetical protein D6683_01760 [Actinomyces sp.]